MSRRLERAWVRMLDSAQWRRTAQGPVLRGVRGSDAFAALDLTRRSALSRLHAWRARGRYADIDALCLLVGHTKSGGSLVGALLDAHPGTAFADEADVLAYVSSGFTPAQVFSLLEKAARREAMKGNVTARRLEPYSFAVPGQSQGRSTTLRVVGAAKAGIATQRLGADVDVLGRLQDWLGDVELRLLQVVRNPFDPMSAMMLRSGRSAESAIERYFANCAVLEQLHARLPSSMITVLRYEDMVADPVGQLRAVCAFLGLDAQDHYLEACASVVAARDPERTLVEWDADQIDRVEEEMAAHTFLRGYSFAPGSDRP